MKRIRVIGTTLFRVKGKEPRLFLPNTTYTINESDAKSQFLNSRLAFIEDVVEIESAEKKPTARKRAVKTGKEK